MVVRRSGVPTARKYPGDHACSEGRIRDASPDVPGMRRAARHRVGGQRLSRASGGASVAADDHQRTELAEATGMATRRSLPKSSAGGRNRKLQCLLCMTRGSVQGQGRAQSPQPAPSDQLLTQDRRRTASRGPSSSLRETGEEAGLKCARLAITYRTGAAACTSARVCMTGRGTSVKSVRVRARTSRVA
jgi:hypothetical protein